MGDDVKLEGLRTMFLNPKGYNILPYKNYDSDDGRPELTSFFIPAHKFGLTSKYLDSRGVTNWPKLKEFYEAQRANLSDKDYLNECAEHCFVPREALSKHGDNVFNAELIAERLVQIRVDGKYEKPKQIQLLWDKSSQTGPLSTVKAVESKSSHLYVAEPPLIDPATKKPYKNLYVAGIDAIDMGKSDSASASDVSDFCVVIKKRMFGLSEPKYVAMYKYRPADIREAYDLTLKLLTWYDCKAMLEYTKISIMTYFRSKNKGYLFMSRPEFAKGERAKKNPNAKALIGVPATEYVINHQLELISNYLNDFWYMIDYPEMLDQLLNYSIENKRKFDIIAALGMAELGDEEMLNLQIGKKITTNKEWRDFGWYTDENGIKRRGIIPNDRWKTGYTPRSTWTNKQDDWR